MGPWYYEVVSFDGDYVNLRRTDIESDELNPVALALLCARSPEGKPTHLHKEVQGFILPYPERITCGWLPYYRPFRFASQPFDWFADSSVFMWHLTQKS